jgi:hypothetical protein
MTKALAALRDDLASVNKARTVLRTRADVIGESDLRDRSSAAVLEAFLLLSDVFQDSRDSKIPPAPAEDLQSETTDHTAGQVEKVLRAFDIAEGNGHFYGVLSRAICKAVRTPEVSQGTVCKFKIGDVLRYQAWAGANMPTLTTEQPVDAIRVRKVPGETPVIQYEFFNDGVIRVVDEPDCALVTPAPNAIVAPTSLINSPPDHGGSYE